MRTLLALSAMATATATSLTALAQQADELLVLQPAAAPAAPLPRPPAPQASFVLVDHTLLGTVAVGDRLDFGIVADGLVVNVDRVERRSSTRLSIFGRLGDDPAGNAILVVEDDVVAGRIVSPMRREYYKLSYLTGGVHEIGPLDEAAFPGCLTTGAASRPLPPDPDAPPPLPVDVRDADPPEDFTQRGGCPTPPRRLDLLVYYTPAARMQAGGTTAIEALCQLAVDDTNQTYLDSIIGPRAYLVERREINYISNIDMEVDRDRLADPSDGIMDEVHGVRNAYGADVVVLLVADIGQDGCGIAFCTPSDSSEGFCIVAQDCATSPTFTFPHEVGHLQGCAHNLEDEGGFGSCSEFCYSYGHRFFGTSGTGWRTVMSYDNDASDYTRIGKFSNPTVTHDGVPTGYMCGEGPPPEFLGAYNTSTINVTAANRESWRNPRFEVWVDFGYGGVPRGSFHDPWPTVWTGAVGIYAGPAPTYVEPVLRIKAGSTTETVTISKRMRIEACGGLVRIGG